MHRIEVNLETGEQTIIELTPEEIAELENNPPPVPVPPIISDRQFFQQAAVLGIITQAEALAAVKTGTLPTVLQDIIDAEADADKRFAMSMMLSGATIFERAHPMTDPIGEALGMTVEQIDQFFIAAATL